MESSEQETISSEQDWTGEEIAILPTSAIQQKVYRLCFIPNSRRLFMPYSLCRLDALVACVTIMVWYCRFIKYVAELYIACGEHNSYPI